MTVRSLRLYEQKLALFRSRFLAFLQSFWRGLFPSVERFRRLSSLATGRMLPQTPTSDVAELDKLPPPLRQVLELLAAGWNIKEIAARLGISARAAEVCRAKLLRRLGVKNVVEVVKVYLRRSPPHRSTAKGQTDWNGK